MQELYNDLQYKDFGFLDLENLQVYYNYLLPYQIDLVFYSNYQLLHAYMNCWSDLLQHHQPLFLNNLSQFLPRVINYHKRRIEDVLQLDIVWSQNGLD